MGDRSGNVCPRAQTGMLRSAALMMALALGGTVAMVELGIGMPWRLGLVLLFLAAFLELFQAFSATCVFRAAVGRRVTNQGSEPIANPADLVRIRHRASRVLAAAALTATAATGLVAVLS